MTSVPTERPDADAPTPQHGVEQAAADQAAKQRQPQEQESTRGTVADLIGDISDVTDVVGGIFSIFE